MKTPKHKQLNTQIYSQASDWFIEFRSGDIDAAGRREFYDWLRTSPEHMRAYLELAAIWNEGMTLDAGRVFEDAALAAALLEQDTIAPIRPQHVDTRSKQEDVDSQSNMETEHRVPRVLTGTRRVFAWAASVMVTVLAAGYWYAYVRNTYMTGVGEQRTLTLNDGSRIELNSETRIQVAYNDGERRINLLDGQALFHVTHDFSRPFIVHTKTTDIRAVGTEFDVYEQVTGTTVSVVEGRVAVIASMRMLPLPRVGEGLPIGKNGGNFTYDSGGDAVTGAPSAPVGGTQATENGGRMFLAAGEQGIIDSRGTLARTANPNIAAVTAWTQHQLVFKGTALRQVAAEFNRYNLRRLVIGDSQLGELKITGTFSSTDPTSFIRFLEARPDIVVTQTGNETLVSRR
jgi:transmembrane sensor